MIEEQYAINGSRQSQDHQVEPCHSTGLAKYIARGPFYYWNVLSRELFFLTLGAATLEYYDFNAQTAQKSIK